MVVRGDTSISFLAFDKLPGQSFESLGGHYRHTGICVDSPEEVDHYYEALSFFKPHSLKTHRDRSYGFYLQDTEGNDLEIIFIPLIPARDELKDYIFYYEEVSDEFINLLKKHAPFNLVKEYCSNIEAEILISGKNKKMFYVDRALDGYPYIQVTQFAQSIYHFLSRIQK